MIDFVFDERPICTCQKSVVVCGTVMCMAWCHNAFARPHPSNLLPFSLLAARFRYAVVFHALEIELSPSDLLCTRYVRN